MRLIDANALMEECEKRQGQQSDEYCDCFLNDAQEVSTEWWCVEDMIQSAPTIDTVPVVHGRWVKHQPSPSAMEEFHALGIGLSMGVNSIYWTCSECGAWGTPINSYCPYCGAKMDGGAEDA